VVGWLSVRIDGPQCPRVGVLGTRKTTMNAPLRCSRNKTKVAKSEPGLAPEREPRNAALASLGRYQLATARAACERPELRKLSNGKLKWFPKHVDSTCLVHCPGIISYKRAHALLQLQQCMPECRAWSAGRGVQQMGKQSEMQI
jgi:hypothetical protein